MGFPKHIFRKANQILSQRRQEAEQLAVHQKQELYSAIPELRDIEKQLSDCGRGVIAAVAAQNGDARRIVELMKERSLALQARRSQILSDCGVPESCLQPSYHCPLCQDSGYVNNRRCGCMEQLLRKLASEELAGTGLGDFTFDNFSLELYGDPSVRESMSLIKHYCMEYARTFDPKCSGNLLFMGGTGLGKTHLSLAIAEAVIQKGHGVIYASMQNLMSRLEEERFQANSFAAYNQEEPEQRYLSMVLDCDLLILDDLGTEYLNQFVSSSIYNLLNTRLLQNKPTIISTNLLAAEIGKRYSDRLVSRLYGSYKALTFVGRDIRIQKNFM